MKKRFFAMLGVVVMILSMGMTVMAVGSIVGSIDTENTSAKDESGNPVAVTVTEGKTNYDVIYSDQKVQLVVNAMNDSTAETSVGAALGSVPDVDLTQIDRYDAGEVVEERVNVNAYKFLSPVYDVSFDVAPTAANPIKVQFVVSAMADNMTVDVLHYCAEHGWEVLAGKKLSPTLLEVEFHSASPVALIYKLKPSTVGSGSESTEAGSSGSAGTNAVVTSPKTGDVAVMPMLMLSAALGAAGVFAWKKSKKNEYV